MRYGFYSHVDLNIGVLFYLKTLSNFNLFELLLLG